MERGAEQGDSAEWVLNLQPQRLPLGEGWDVGINPPQKSVHLCLESVDGSESPPSSPAT